MNRINKNIIAGGFLLLLALPILVFFTYKVKQHNIKNSSTKKFKTEILQTIIVSKEKVQWVKKGKEIIIDGRYFDVESFVTKEKVVHFTGFYDHKEDKLVKNLKKFIGQNTGFENPYTSSAVNFIFFAVYNQFTDIIIANTWQINQNIFPILSENILERYIPIYCPPPDL